MEGSRDTVLCRSAQENGACTNGSEYINRNNKVAIFTHSYIRDFLSEEHQICGGSACL